MKYYTDEKPEWLTWIAPEQFNDELLYRIVIFYVFHSPCKKLSAMSRTLREYGWTSPWSKPFWLNKQLKQASSNSKLLFSVDKYENMAETLQIADLGDDFPNNNTIERICFYDGQKNQFMSVFFHVRNALAHGRINIVNHNNECYFIMEDIIRENGKIKVSARMILKRATLLNWIDIIEAGETEYVKEDV